METLKHPIVIKAVAFATEAHAGVTRRWTNEPYVEHPKRVAATLAALGFDPDVVAAAVLHDVVEDTPITAAELAAAFGPRIAAFVVEVSKPKVPGNRAARRAAYRAHLAGSSYAGASIKLADMIDNSGNVAEHDPKFAKIYLPELAEAAKVLSHGHPELLARLAENLG
jgi:(p)ppGpp synthase/HD superfamily hydrolase